MRISFLIFLQNFKILIIEFEFKPKVDIYISLRICIRNNLMFNFLNFNIYIL